MQFRRFQRRVAAAPVESRDQLIHRILEGNQHTINGTEHALRKAVIWRKLSFGTQSAEGGRFVERLLTVVETCWRQKRKLFS